jgi:hypothetical protein
MLCITGIQFISIIITDIILTVYSLYKARRQRDKCCFEMYKNFRRVLYIEKIFEILRNI